MKSTDNLTGLIPHGTRAKCRLQSCDRTRHFKSGEKNQYETRWLVTEGEHAGTILMRSLWDTQKAQKMMHEWCRKLDIEHIDTLCQYRCPIIEIEGVVGISEGLEGEVKNDLWYIERRIRPNQPHTVKPSDTSAHDRDLPEPF